MSGLISVDDALMAIRNNRPPLQTETIPIEASLRRRLSAPVIARRTHPPAAMSAMDGYAVKLADVSRANARLHVIGEAPAGRPFEGIVGAGEAVRIFTGSVVPRGSDHVIIQENTERDGDTLISLQEYDAPAHIRAAGLDFSENETLITAGTQLSPEHLSLVAAGNNSAVEVERKLRVGLLSNGDELRAPGSELLPGEIINSNPYGLTGLIERWGGEAVNLGIAPDNQAAIGKTIAQAEDVDVFVPIGGASVGDHDHMRAAFAARNFTPVFEKIAVRPGKPTWFSKSPEALVLGLPGNPASSLVCAHLFLAPLLGDDWQHRLIRGSLLSDVSNNGPREHFMRARAELDSNGQFTINPAPSQDSSLLRPFLSCNVLLRRLPDAAAVNAGENVEALAIGPLLQ